MATRLIAAIAVLATAAASHAAEVRFTEDFEGAVLRPSPEERPFPPVPVWTDELAGWTVDDSGVPGVGDQAAGGIDDWEGWAFVDSAFWVSADDQRRSEFRDGFANSSIVAVADADEWDDVNSPADNLGFYNAFMKSPEFDISGSSVLTVKFDSSWRDEAFDDDGVAGDTSDDNTNNQTALMTLYVDGVAQEILRWESDQASPFFKDDAPNESISFDVTGLSGSVGQLEFGLANAGNDWWWAVDNIEVSVPEPTSALLAAFGLVAAARRR